MPECWRGLTDVPVQLPPTFLKLFTISAFVAPKPLIMSRMRHTVTYPSTEKAHMLGMVSVWRMECSQASQISPVEDKKAVKRSPRVWAWCITRSHLPEAMRTTNDSAAANVERYSITSA